MECVSYTIEAEVPPELSSASTCTTAFFRMATNLEQLEGKEAIRKHTLFATRRGHLVEVEGGKVQRSTPSPKDVIKIVVHHDFEPVQLYIVLLCASGHALLLAYHDFKVLQKWERVKGVTSEDNTATGAPHLILTRWNDTTLVISNAQLMGKDCEGDKEMKEEDAPGKKEAIHALMHRFKGGIKLAEQLKTERRMKENFIAEELTVLQSQLQGQVDDRVKSLVATLPVDEREGEQKDSVPSLAHNPLRVLRVYHKLIHDKWVIGVSVINEKDQVLVSDIELIVCCGELVLCHTSQVLKTVKHSRPQGENDVRVTVDHLYPPTLRPMKKATVVAVCELPSFEAGPSMSCSGLLSYMCKPLKIASSQSLQANKECQVHQQYQVSVPLVELKASELHCHLASFELNNSNTACVTFSTVAFVAASKCTHVSLTSLVFPLNTFLTRVSNHLKVVKVSGVSDFYILHPGESHPLQYTGFILHPVNSHYLNLTLYSKDDKQSLVLAHTLLAVLPEDASMQMLPSPKDNGSPDSQPLNLHYMLLAKMRETVTLATDGLEAQLGSNKTLKKERKEGCEEQKDMFSKYAGEREQLLARKEDVTFKGEEYSVWRKKLQDVQAEVDDLYLKFLKLHCTSD